MKRLNAPRHWMLNKLGGTWAPRPSTGPHKLRECLPVSLILRNRLKYSLTRRETNMIVMRRFVKVDNKVRTDLNYPAGFMDTVSIEKTNDHFRLMYDIKGRFQMVKLDKKEIGFKLLRVQQMSKANRTTAGSNPFLAGQAGAIPYVVTHDGRTIRYPDPNIKVNDTVKFDLVKNEIVGFLKFEVGNMVMITRGKNIGRVGVIADIEKHPGSFDIVHVKDKRGHLFATRLQNVFIIGDKKEWVSLPKQKGVKLSVLEERNIGQPKKADK